MGSAVASLKSRELNVGVRGRPPMDEDRLLVTLDAGADFVGIDAGEVRSPLAFVGFDPPMTPGALATLPFIGTGNNRSGIFLASFFLTLRILGTCGASLVITWSLLSTCTEGSICLIM